MVRRRADAGRGPLRRHDARPGAGSWRRRCCGSSCPSSGATEQVPVVLALLDAVAAARRRRATTRLRETLDRLIERTRRRYPEVAAQARTRALPPVRPAARRADAAAVTSARMRALALGPRRPGRPIRQLVDELVARPLPLMPILAADDLFGATPTPGALIEVLAAALLQDPRAGAGRARRRRRRAHVLRAPRPGRPRARRPRRRGRPRRRARPRSPPRPSTVAAPDTVVVDLFLARPAGSPADADALSARLGRRARRRRAARARAPGRARRLAPRRRHRRAHVPPARRDRASGRSGWAEGDGAVDPAALRGGRHVPRPAPDDRPPAADVAAVELRDHPPAGRGRRRRRQPVRLHRPRQPVRRAPRRRGRGPRPDADPRRARPGRRPARGRERARRLPRRHPPGARGAPGAAAPRVEPGDALRLADDRPAARRGLRRRPPPDAADRGPRPRAGRGVGPARPARRVGAGRDGDAARLRARARASTSA